MSWVTGAERFYSPEDGSRRIRPSPEARRCTRAEPDPSRRSGHLRGGRSPVVAGLRRDGCDFAQGLGIAGGDRSRGLRHHERGRDRCRRLHGSLRPQPCRGAGGHHRLDPESPGRQSGNRRRTTCSCATTPGWERPTRTMSRSTRRSFSTASSLPGPERPSIRSTSEDPAPGASPSGPRTSSARARRCPRSRSCETVSCKAISRTSTSAAPASPQCSRSIFARRSRRTMSRIPACARSPASSEPARSRRS